MKDKEDGKLDLSDWIIEANRFDQFNSSNLASCIGTGYRYLIARKFGLRMGMDVAFSSDDWGYYIIFGSNWIR
jgi:hypothetical protein